MFCGLGLSEEFEEPVLLKMFEDIFHCLEVPVGIISGADQKYHRINEFFIERGKIDPGIALSDGGDDIFSGLVFDMGHGDALAHSSACFFFSFYHCLYYFLAMSLAESAGFVEL